MDDKVEEKKQPKNYFDDRRKVKDEIRIIGIDDSPFSSRKKEEILILGTIHRGGGYMEGIVSSYVLVDGIDATSKMIRMVNKTKHKAQLQAIMLDGIAVGGFNVVDIQELSERTHLPVIVIMRHKPNIKNIKKALENVKDGESRYNLMKKAGQIFECSLTKGKIYYQCYGVSEKKAQEIIKISIKSGNMPEPIRTAHIIASGIIEGESRGRA
jgi:uncharacterized protein